MTFSSLRLLALDTSHLIELIRHKDSESLSKRSEAEAFERTMLEEGFILFLSLHHIAELMSYHDDGVVERSLRYLRRLPVAAWIASTSGSGIAGAITDLIAAEVKSAFREPEADIFHVRNSTQATVVRFGPAAEALAGLDAAPAAFREEFRRQTERHRSVIAISRTADFGGSRERIVDLSRRPIRSPTKANHLLEKMQGHLAENVKARGDKKIADPESVATEFFQLVKSGAEAFYNAESNPVISFLEKMGLHPAEITKDMTVENATDIIQFRQHLEIASTMIGIPFDSLKATVRPEQIPSWNIQRGLTRWFQKLNRHDGSEWTDTILACLAPYVELCTVDKRTYENVTRAGRNIPEFKALTSSVRKAARYSEVLPSLA